VCDQGTISDISKVVGAGIETSKRDRAGMGILAPKIKN
jgi:hypothetical protein